MEKVGAREVIVASRGKFHNGRRRYQERKILSDNHMDLLVKLKRLSGTTLFSLPQPQPQKQLVPGS